MLERYADCLFRFHISLVFRLTLFKNVWRNADNLKDANCVFHAKANAMRILQEWHSQCAGCAIDSSVRRLREWILQCAGSRIEQRTALEKLNHKAQSARSNFAVCMQELMCINSRSQGGNDVVEKSARMCEC